MAALLAAACIDIEATRCSGASPAEGCPERSPALDPTGASPAGGASGFCGDGRLNLGEQCDNGSACVDGRDCTDDRYRCQAVSQSECQPRPGDGCSDDCTVEAGYECRDGLACQPRGVRIEQPDAGLAPTVTAPVVASSDAAPPAPACGPGGFGPPEPLVGFDAEVSLWAPSPSADGRTLYYAASGAEPVERLFRATRVSENEFTDATELSELNSGDGEGTPLSSADGLELYFYSLRPGGAGDRDVWFATRPDVTSPFAGARPLANVNGNALDHLPWLSPDELTLTFVSSRADGLGQSDIWVAERSTAGDEFDAPVPLAQINSSQDEGRAVLADDGTMIIFASTRAGGAGEADLWMATRNAPSEPFGEPFNLTSLNGPSRDLDPALSADARELFFATARNGRTQLWRAVRVCRDRIE